MKDETCKSNREIFEDYSGKILHTLFDQSLDLKLGEIELRTFAPQTQSFHSNLDSVLDRAFELGSRGIDVYFGLHLRAGKSGSKEDIHYLNTFHAQFTLKDKQCCGDCVRFTHKERDYAYENYLTPIIISRLNQTYNFFWMLEKPVKVEEVGIKIIENINKNIIIGLGADQVSHDISSLVRLPGTYALRDIRYLQEDSANDDKYPKHSLLNFIMDDLYDFESEIYYKSKSKKKTSKPLFEKDSKIEIEELPVSSRIKSLILTESNNNDQNSHLNDPINSEYITVICALVDKGMDIEDIKRIFEIFPIGNWYRDSNYEARFDYLTICIQRVWTMMNKIKDDLPILNQYR